MPLAVCAVPLVAALLWVRYLAGAARVGTNVAASACSYSLPRSLGSGISYFQQCFSLKDKQPLCDPGAGLLSVAAD